MNQVERGIYKYYTDDGHPLGYFPSPVDMSYLDSAGGNAYMPAAMLTNWDGPQNESDYVHPSLFTMQNQQVTTMKFIRTMNLVGLRT